MQTSQVAYSLFDVDKWTRAMWRATLFMSHRDPQVPPCLGIAFENGELGKEVFRELRNVIGDDDTFDELQISIIEGDIPGEEPGYSVHVFSEPDNTAKRIGKPPLLGDITIASKVHRMNPHAGSPYLPQFKLDFARHGRYLLIPATFDSRSETAIPHIELSIGKHHVRLRHASEIGPDDVDAYVVYGDVASRYVQ
jgi:hypothetical protein